MAYPSPSEFRDWGSTASTGLLRSPKGFYSACGCGEYAPVEEPEFESCKSHWSELRSSDVEEDIAEANRKAFRQFRKKWPNGFFQELQWNLESREKIAEGAQGEIYITQGSVWKVFKLEDASLFLEEQLPLGLYQNYSGVGLKNHYCWVHGARLFRDGRIAFKMWRYWGDLRKLIDLRIHDYFEKLISDLKLHSLIDLKGHLIRSAVLPPFSCSVGYRLMWEIALGMQNLRERNIPHRDLKASNVLIMPSTQTLNHCPRHSEEFSCVVADYECCVGVLGTRFWRAPEILQALKERSICSKPLLFTESSDVYSYAMTCYEILTGKIPFEDLQANDYEAIYSGKVKLQWPEHTAPQIKALLQRCTHLQPSMRPTFKEICVTLNSLLDNLDRKSRLQLLGKVEYTDKTSTSDVSKILWSLGVAACVKELEPMIRKVDCDNDGFIHCGQLIDLITLFKRTLNDEEWSFRVQLAKNGKYFARTSIADVPMVLWSFGVAACHDELNAIVCKVDSHNDGFEHHGALLHLVTLFKRTLDGEEWSFRVQLAKEVEYFEKTSNGDVPQVLWSFGVAACDDDLEAMLSEVDCDKDGFITCKELIDLVMLFKRTLNGEEWSFRVQLAKGVEYFERMSTGDVPKVLWSSGVAARHKQLVSMLKKVDRDKDGFMTCKELIELIMRFKKWQRGFGGHLEGIWRAFRGPVEDFADICGEFC
ncbi:hypothetical protein M758_4G246400 [Ceratodon purpureus]|nr:hypothetical protein M758_4G246400 [Ceratodon purpureus]